MLVQKILVAVYTYAHSYFKQNVLGLKAKKDINTNKKPHFLLICYIENIESIYILKYDLLVNAG